MSRIIGIDLGTTNSCVAVLDDKGVPKTLAGADGERTIPSWVSWSPQGQIAVGQRARRQGVTNAAATIFGAKRLIGRKANAEAGSWFAGGGAGARAAGAAAGARAARAGRDPQDCRRSTR